MFSCFQSITTMFKPLSANESISLKALLQVTRYFNMGAKNRNHERIATINKRETGISLKFNSE